MEREYKWSIASEAQFHTIVSSDTVAPLVQSHETISMEATYYDTFDKQIEKAHGGLRLRRENNESIACLKLAPKLEYNGALKSREEYECYAPDIRSGILNLPSFGAPQDFCDAILKADLMELGRTDFLREAYTIRYAGCTCELAFDTGHISRRGRSAPICEIELEHKDGSTKDFHALAQLLQSTFALEPECRSKLMRMLHL